MYAETSSKDCNERDDAQRALGPCFVTLEAAFLPSWAV